MIAKLYRPVQRALYIFVLLSLCVACQPLERLSDIEIAVDGTGHHAGPLPVVFYALTEPGGDDIYPQGEGAYALYGLLDSAWPAITINRRDPPNRVNAGNWGMSDAAHLQLDGAAVGNLRLNCISRCSVEGYIPIGSPETPNGPQIEVRDVAFVPGDEDVTRIGAPAINKMVVIIDYTELFADQRMGIPVPYIDFYTPNDAEISAADVVLPLALYDSGSGDQALGHLYRLRNVVFQNGGHSVSSNENETRFLLSTASPTSLVNDALAATLGLEPGAGAFDCEDGSKNGYVIDSVTMPGLDGSYTIRNASVCWAAEDEMKHEADALIGANFFDQVQLKLDGPGASLGIILSDAVDDGTNATGDVADLPDGVEQEPSEPPSRSVSFTLVNKSNAEVCYAFITPVDYQGGYIERLDGEKIPPGTEHAFELESGRYGLYLSDCSDQLLLFKNYVDIAAEPTVVLSDRDVGIAACQTPNRFGMRLYEGGQYADALALFEEAYACYQALPYALGEGETLHNIAVVQLRYGEYAQAISTHHRALAIARSTSNRDGESASLAAIAKINFELGEVQEALENLQESQTIRRELHDRAGEATIVNNIAYLYKESGLFDLAHEAYEEVLAIRREAIDRVGTARALNNIGHLYISEGRYPEARDTFKQALAIVEQPISRDRSLEGNIWTGIGVAYANEEQFDQALDAATLALDIAREVGDPLAEGTNLNNVARCLDRLGRSEEASARFKEAMDLFESVRVRAGDRDARAGFIGRHAEVYGNAASFFFRQGAYEEVFRIAERARARSFLDVMGGLPVKFGGSETQEAVQQEQELRLRIVALQENLAAQKSLSAEDQDQEALENLTSELENTGKEYDGLIERLRTENAAYVSLVSVAPLTLSQVQQLLGDTTTMLEYFVLEDATLAIMIDNESIQVVSLDIQLDDLRSKVIYLANQIRTQQTDPVRAGELFDLLIAPLKAHLEHENLIIVPHSVLHYLPFCALWDAAQERYLVEDYTISYVPSSSVLQYMSEKDNPNDGQMLALGNPDSTIRYAEASVRSVAALFDAKLLTGDQATETAFRNEVRDYDYLHLSAHGKFLAHSPLLTRIELVSDDENDGFLEVREVYDLDLSNVNLVVLSACNTALGEQSAGDELVGLTRAFLYSGTPNVITTLWSIEGKSSGYLMTRFYELHLGGLSMAQALREAQIATLAQEEWRDPYYWAAFELTGRQ